MHVAPGPSPSQIARFVLGHAVAAAVRAPSAQNTQPWRFRIVGDALEVQADPHRQLSVIDAESRQQVLSCGCALFNARVALRAWGYHDVVTLAPADDADQNLLATVRVGAPRSPSTTDLMLMNAIEHRHTNRRAFVPRPVADGTAHHLAAAALAEGAWMVQIGPDQKTRLGQLVEHADQRQFGDDAFREELARWLISYGSDRRDGIPFIEKEVGSALPFSVMRALRSPTMSPDVGSTGSPRIVGAPLVIVLGTNDDTRADWLACGQALQALLLHATSLGLSAAFLNQVLEIAPLREEVATLLGRGGAPQMILRLGFPSEPVHHPAPRREVDDVLEIVG